jgi:pyruvate/2-oxoglutarate dehydrogenase complex dihydrolipoamide dehydrogenase (E3) component
MDRMRRRRLALAPHDSIQRLTSLDIDVFLGHARFTGTREVGVGADRLRFRRAVLATGSTPAVPPIDGLAGTPFLTSDSVFSLTSLPRRLLVVGAGPVGCELAQAFARFGSRVTLCDLRPRVLANDEPDASAIVARALTADGVQLALGCRLVRTRTSDGGVVLQFEQGAGGEIHEVAGDQILIAAGRLPAVSDLDLDRAGIDVTHQGIVIDDRLRTSNRRVFAAGDVCARFQFTHAADAMARIVVQNALFLGRRRASALTIPWCTYTDPQVAHVGESASAAAGGAPAAIEVPLSAVDRAVLDGETDGFLRVYHRHGRLTGCTIVSSVAGDLIGMASHLVRTRARLTDLSATVFPYPTQADAFRKAGDAYRRSRVTPRVRRVFASYFTAGRWRS